MAQGRVVVVGAGPSGSAAAMQLAAAGVECILLEKKQLPRTKACGSGLSPWTLTLLDELGVGASVRKLAYRIDGAILCGSSGKGLELRGDHETAILRRAEFDELLAREAERRGASLRQGVSVRGLGLSGTGPRASVTVETSDGPLEADLVIDCSGATGRLDRYAGPAATPGGPLRRQVAERVLAERRTLHTIMGWYEGVEGCSDVVELFFDAELRPHYAWIFPETRERVNIGLCFLPREGGPNAREHFERFIARRLERRLKKATLLGRWIGHPVSVSTAPQALVSDGVLRAGEAGWLADSATAEGIFHALSSGRAAGRFAAAHLRERGATRAAALLPYQRTVQRTLAGRLTMGRALMSALTVPTLDLALRIGDKPATRRLLRRAFTGLYHG
jgi:geranylgeranyl reductase family protein